MSKKTNTLYWLILVFILSTIIILFSYLQQTKEYFDILLNHDYPLTKHQNVTDNEASDVWKYYPEFKISSFKQITNNLKYFRNPDIGICSPEEFCGSLYKDKNHPVNTARWLKPVSTTSSEIRVNYYNTKPNLVI